MSKKILRAIICGMLIFVVNMVYAQYQYPKTKTVNVSDTYFGVTYKDPYRWMENLKDEEVLDWLKEQEKLTSSILNRIPGRKLLLEEQKAILQKELENKISYPFGKHGNTWYFYKLISGDQTPKLYRRTGDDGDDELLFDPVSFEKNKVFQVQPSLDVDGDYLLLNLSEQGTEFSDIHILDLKTKKMLPQHIPFSSGSFSRSNPHVLYYTQYNSDDVYSMENRMDWKIKRHFVGTDPSADKVVVSKETNPELNLIPEDEVEIRTFPYSKYAFLEMSLVPTARKMFFAPVSSLESDGHVFWKRFCANEDEIQKVICRNEVAYCITTKGNDMGRIIAVNIEKPDFQNSELIFDTKEGWKIEDILETKDYLTVTLSKNNLEFKCLKYDYASNRLSELKIPLDGAVKLYPASAFSNEITVLNMGWLQNFKVYQYDLASDKLTEGIFYDASRLDGMEDLVSKTFEIPSHDGAMVPLTLVYDSKLMKGDGSNICLLSGYGAYGMSIPPNFQSANLPLLKRGVIIAVAHVRGGSEKGINWYLAGKKLNKPNTWKDFNACAEYLIKNKYTSANKLGCESASAGGILIGRAITERPDLYRVAIPKVGVLNMLRMEFTPNGPSNIPEFGTVTDSLEFHGLLEMDAMYHVKQGVRYPAQLITTGFNDPRVIAWMPAKFAAMMQSASSSRNPVLLKVDFQSGHFGGSTLDEALNEEVNVQSFLLWQCGHPEFQE